MAEALGVKELRLVKLLQEYDEAGGDDRKKERTLKDLGELMVNNQGQLRVLVKGESVVKMGWGMCACGSKTPVTCSGCRGGD